jgi:hypothetical protein
MFLDGLRAACRVVNLNLIRTTASRLARFVAFVIPIGGVIPMGDDELKAWVNAEVRRCRSLGRPSTLQRRLMDENTNPRALMRAKQIRQELLDAEASGSTPECVRSILNAASSRSSRASSKGHSFSSSRAAYASTARERAVDRGRSSTEESATRADVRQTRRSWVQRTLDLFGGRQPGEKR